MVQPIVVAPIAKCKASALRAADSADRLATQMGRVLRRHVSVKILTLLLYEGLWAVLLHWRANALWNQGHPWMALSTVLVPHLWVHQIAGFAVRTKELMLPIRITTSLPRCCVSKLKKAM